MKSSKTFGGHFLSWLSFPFLLSYLFVSFYLLSHVPLLLSELFTTALFGLVHSRRGGWLADLIESPSPYYPPLPDMTFSMSRFPSLISSRPQERHLRWPSSTKKHLSKMPFQHPLVHLLAIVILVLCSAVFNHGKSASAAQGSVCATYDLPNPLAEAFPNNATGVLNATLAIIPIPLGLARRLIPHQYGILEEAYRALLPDFPEGMYPVMLQAAHDHDVQFRAYGITLDDFSVCPWFDD